MSLSDKFRSVRVVKLNVELITANWNDNLIFLIKSVFGFFLQLPENFIHSSQFSIPLRFRDELQVYAIDHPFELKICFLMHFIVVFFLVFAYSEIFEDASHNKLGLVNASVEYFRAASFDLVEIQCS
jgi:hypothetical protein